jgi:hypothetical protein
VKSSRISFWAAVGVVAVLTVLPKVGRPPKGQTEIAAEATEHLRGFLAPLSVAPLQKIQQKPPLDDWSGWRFAASGCNAVAFPSGPGSELTASARLHAGAGDKVQFIYHGTVLERPPTTRLAFDYLTSRLFLQSGPFYVVLIRPAACETPLKLPWAKL